MQRRNFLRNIVFGIAASVLPKVLRPMDVTGKCLFDIDKINAGLKELREWPGGTPDNYVYMIRLRRGNYAYFIHRDHVGKLYEMRNRALILKSDA